MKQEFTYEQLKMIKTALLLGAEALITTNRMLRNHPANHLPYMQQVITTGELQANDMRKLYHEIGD